MGFSKFIRFLPIFGQQKSDAVIVIFFIKSLLKILLITNNKLPKKFGDDRHRNVRKVGAKRIQCLQFVFRPIQIVNESVSDSEKVR